MLTAIEDNGLLLIRADGTLSDSDYDRFVPFFERVAARVPGTVPMLIELAPDFSGWDMGGLWRDLKFDAKHKDSFGRIAMVGDSLHDLVAARAAGMHAVAVLTGHADERRLTGHADVVLPDIGYLPGWLGF